MVADATASERSPKRKYLSEVKESTFLFKTAADGSLKALGIFHASPLHHGPRAMTRSLAQSTWSRFLKLVTMILILFARRQEPRPTCTYRLRN